MMLDIPRRLIGLPFAAVRSVMEGRTAGSDPSGGAQRRRKVVQGRPGRVYLPVRGVHRPEGEPVATALEEALTAVEGVHWAAVNPVLAEVVIAFEDGSVSVDDLADIVDSVESEHGLQDEELAPTPEHPADLAPIHRGMVALAADMAGAGIGVAARAMRLPRLPVQITNAIPALDSLGPVRRALEARPQVEMATIAVNAVLHGFGQQPLGLVVDVLHRSSLLTELAARRRAWLALEPDLYVGPPSRRPPVIELEPRPQPRPAGLVERYGKTASLASLAGAGVTLAATRDPRRTADVLLVGLPRAARLGVDAFASQLGRELACREVVPMDPHVLRRLDRIDTVVIDASTVATGRFSVGEMIVVGTTPPAGAEEAARSLFDPHDPGAAGERDGWSLQPAHSVEAKWPRGAKGRARSAAVDAVGVLALSRNGVVAGLVTVRPEVHPGTAQVVAAARGAACHIAVAGVRSGVGAVLGADRLVSGGDHLARSIRALQAEGRVVALVSSRPGAALRAADCGVGVLRAEQEHPPWGADVLCSRLVHAARVLDAIPAARTACRQAVACAAIGSSVGSLLALRPLPGSSQRAITAVQLSAIAAIAGGTWTATQLPVRREITEAEPVRWDTIDPDEVLSRLGSGPAGLSATEASRRPKPTPSEAGQPSLARLLVAEVTNPLSLILGGGAALSAMAGSIVDAAMIGAALGADALIGIGERLRTEAAISRLAAAISEGTVRVLRDGSETVTSSGAVVVGDVVQLAAGDAVPADCRLIEAMGVEIDESSLTGESLLVVKDPKPVDLATPVAERHSMVYAGTAVAAGRGTAVVVATGGDTEARRGDDLVVAPKTGVQSRLEALTKATVPVVLGSGAVLALNSVLRGRPVREAVASGVSLAAAAVPEGLPFVATVAQAGAAHRLARRGVLVRNAGVLEALGRVDVLCFDKTGTLTEGRLRLHEVSDGRIEQPASELSGRRRAVLAAALRATPRPRGRALPHPTDQAVVDGAAAAGIRHSAGAPGWRKVASLPFEPGRSFHAVLGESHTGPLLSVKGAPEVILPRCAATCSATGDRVALDAAGVADAEAAVERLARRGLRVLAVAERPASDRSDLDDERVVGLELLGFVGVADEARPNAAGPLAQLIRAGINCVMVTGDHPSTGEAIATDLGLLNGRRVITGVQLDQLDDAELDRIITEVSVFARVTPTDKVRIVGAFQRAGRVVAMTGDGANDAQAIRMAEIGVAFGPRATSAARNAADLVVSQDDLGVLIDTIVEGRAMWASVRDALSILLGGNLGEVAFTTGAALLSGQPPLNARQLLAVNLFTDLAPAMALAVKPPATRRIELAREGPETSLAGPLARDVAVRATATAAGAYGAWLAARFTGSGPRARTVALAALIGTQLGQTLAMGHRSPLVAGTAIASAAGLVVVIQTPGVSQFFGCRPLGPVGWSIAAGAAAVSTGLAGVAKRVIR